MAVKPIRQEEILTFIKVFRKRCNQHKSRFLKISRTMKKRVNNHTQSSNNHSNPHQYLVR
jgi:thermostable 8-oxoguanine DNA glycosylase